MFIIYENWLGFLVNINYMSCIIVVALVISTMFCFVGVPRIIKDTIAFSRHPINFFNGIFKKYGTIELKPIPFRIFPLVKQKSLFISNPSHIMQMLNNRHKDFSEGSHPAFLKVFKAALPYTTVTEETKELW